MKLVKKSKKGRGSRFGFRGLEAAITVDLSTGGWSPGTGPREALGGEAHVTDVADTGTRRHLDAGDSRNGGSIEGGLAVRGHAECRALSRHRAVDVDHAGHLLRGAGAAPDR